MQVDQEAPMEPSEELQRVDQKDGANEEWMEPIEVSFADSGKY